MGNLYSGVKGENEFAMCEKTFNWILENIEKGSKILELGSGTGTIELCKYYDVTSIEDNTDWVGYVKDAKYIHAPLKNYNNYVWYDIDTLKDIPSDYDFLIIDGPVGGYRSNIIHHINLFKTDIPILCDDLHRTNDLNLAKSLSTKLNKKLDIHTGIDKMFGILL